MLGGWGASGAWDMGKLQWSSEDGRDWGNGWSNPHFMQGTSTRPAVALPALGPPSPCQAPGKLCL